MVLAVPPPDDSPSPMAGECRWKHAREHEGNEVSRMRWMRRRSGVAGAAALCVAVLVLARGDGYDSFHAAAMLQLQQLTNWRTGVLGGKASLVTQCAKVVAVCQPVCANVSLSLQECVHACTRTVMHK